MADTTRTSPPLNPFDPAALVLDQSFAETVGVKKLLPTVPVRKPNRQDFVRAHPDPAYRLTAAAIIELTEDREVYLVTPAMAMELPREFAAATLHTRRFPPPRPHRRSPIAAKIWVSRAAARADRVMRIPD